MTTNDKRPVWLLDVDGVINVAVGDPDYRPNTWPAESWVHLDKLHQYPFLTARPVLKFIEDMHASGLVEIRWHTTWQHNARLIEDAFDLPELPIAEAPEFDAFSRLAKGGKVPLPREWWKLGAARRVVFREHRPLIWSDDDLAWRTRGVAREIRAMKAAQPVLTIAPDDMTGLTRRHLEVIEGFVRERAGIRRAHRTTRDEVAA